MSTDMSKIYHYFVNREKIPVIFVHILADIEPMINVYIFFPDRNSNALSLSDR